MLRIITVPLLLLMGLIATAQTRQLSGVVSDDASGKGIVAVSVKVKGQPGGTTTNTDGEFTLSVPAGRVTLEISSAGYTAKEVYVEDGSTSVSVSLTQNSQQLSEVVVTALGIKKEQRKVGYAVTTVSGDNFTKARETNVALSLAGQAAGLNVHGTNGGPGGSARILLRGMPSINSGGSPLFVINGVPMDNTQRGAAGEWGGSDNGDGIGNINPDDIESMTILKGQAASAIYGARASNGVILVTTKTGKRGSATVEFNTNFAFDKAIDNTEFQYEYGQGQNGLKPTTVSGAQATGRLTWGAKLDGSQVIQFDGNSYAYSAQKNNIKNFYRTGPTYTNTVSVSGGGDRGTYRLSLSNLDNSAILRNSGIDRKTINLNMDQKITDKLTVTLMANYIDQKNKNNAGLSDGPGNPNNGFFLASNIDERILAPGYDANGNEIVFSDDPYVTNPYFVINKWINNSSRKRLITSVSAKYNFTSWLYAMTRLGYDHINDRSEGVTPTGTAYNFNSAGQSGGIGIGNSQTTELNVDGIIGATHKITNDIGIDATIGANLRKNDGESIGISGGPFVIPGLYTPNNVVSFGRSYGVSHKEVHSAFYSIDLSYKNLITLSTTGRYDAFSTLYYSGLEKSKRNIFIPSVSASFQFADLLNLPVLNYGKLRASYAQTSGEPGAPYQTAVYYGVGNSINGVPTGNFSSGLPNLFLKPFTLTEFEVGTELKFLNSRLGFDIAYYTKKTKNEIMNASLSPATGYTSTVIANGSVENKGLEVQVTGTPIKQKDFQWNVTLNFTTVSNKILKTDAGNTTLGLGTYRPLNANTAFVVGMSGPQIMANDYTYDSKGDIVVDASGLPVVGSRIPMGSVLPKAYGGLKNDFTYKAFNLSFLIDYNFGNKILSATSYYSIYRGLNKMTLEGRETGITTGVTASGTANTVTATAQAYYQRLASISRINVLDGDYIKLRQITLGYTISEKMLGNIPLFRAINISLVGRNLLTLMKKSDNIDPESSFNPNINYSGIEGTSLPSVRTFGINANFKFKN
jgi:TonB-linked SusC/RagA family outer membrane protein